MPSTPTPSVRPARWRRRHQAAAVGCVLALAGITSAALATTSAGGPSLPAAARPGPQQGPPPVRLVAGGVVLALDPYTSCWSTASSAMCYDGIPPTPLPSLGGTTAPVRLAFDRSDWRFSGTMVDPGGTARQVRLVRIGPKRWRLALGPLPDGRYRADVFGGGPQGDVAAAFALTVR
jgi:hypothetical protein